MGDTITNPTPEAATFSDLTTTSKLKFTNAQTSDTGFYKCEAAFSDTKIESTAATVSVVGAFLFVLIIFLFFSARL